MTAGCFALVTFQTSPLLAQATSKAADKSVRPTQHGSTNSSYEPYVPDTISPQAQQVLRMMTGPQGLPLPGPNDIEGWKKIRNYVPPQLKEIAKNPEISRRTSDAIKRYPSTSKKGHFRRVPVLEIASEKWQDNGK